MEYIPKLVNVTIRNTIGNKKSISCFIRNNPIGYKRNFNLEIKTILIILRKTNREQRMELKLVERKFLQNQI